MGMHEDRGNDTKRKNTNTEGEGGNDFNDITRRVRDIPRGDKTRPWQASKHDETNAKGNNTRQD
jgi:hypothetical protein